MSSEAVQKYSDRADKEPSIERLRAASILLASPSSMSNGIFFLHTRTDARTPGGPWPLAPLASAIHRIIIPRFHQHHDSRGSDDRGEATLPQTSQRCDHGCCNIHLHPERVPALRRLLLLLPIDGGGGHRSGGTFSPTVVPRFIVQSWDPGEGGWNDAV